MTHILSAILATALLGASGLASAQTTPAPMPNPPAAMQPAPSAYTDAQLQAFAVASLEIDPLSRSLQGATPEAQAQAATQIRAILERNSIDSATYNAIATAAQADPALAQRVAALQVGAGANADTGGAQN